MILVARCAPVPIAPRPTYAVRLGLLDVPGSAPHKTHHEPTPLTGGLVLTLALWLSYAIVRPQLDRQVLAILAGATWMMVWGALDDRFDLAPFWKIGGQLLAAGLLIGLGIQVHVTRNFGIDLGITVLWVVGMVNAFNLVDSKDGLAIGLASVAAAFFMLVTIDAGQPVCRRSRPGCSACLGVFFFNTSPAYLFLGDSGAQVLGFVLAAVGIAYVPSACRSSPRRLMVHTHPGTGRAHLRHHPGGRFPAAPPSSPSTGQLATIPTTVWSRWGWTSNRSVLAMQLAAVMLACSPSSRWGQASCLPIPCSWPCWSWELWLSGSWSDTPRRHCLV